ncbi:UDP-N-acetylglucosamine pyrophosphorylase [Spironucleus salmonicida]|uniref:UDP-N-acetylglucosamine diphosphorylase n=1 Tax=Spironucleus salmonicida TaxID=348837 RepID=V6LMC0_9EUKA|nr:UDP-N-acetylglucosamine pyrophosphorylase [Spironucleus salmonicida]|eukprot:EST41864.1 UDP-N-acetylglucosamine pyrophosphorylase [Spironucleus salmonicida]
MQIYTNQAPAQELLTQIAQVDTTPIKNLTQLLTAHYQKIIPEQISEKFIINEKSKSEQYTLLGTEIIKQGKVALLIMAGGAATRLGASCPKGAFPLNNSCLFEIIIKNAIRIGSPDIIILLSRATADTEKFFKQNDFFKYNQNKLTFVYQAEYPVVTPTGEILALEHQILQSPNGNAGFLPALAAVNLRNYEFLHVIGVDNPFVKPLEAEMLGFAIQRDLDVVNRVIRPKRNEKVGICGFKRNDCRWQSQIVDLSQVLPEIAPTVFEYSEVNFDEIDLANSFGSIANHLFSTRILLKIQEIQQVGMAVPFHLAIKKVSFFDFQERKIVVPERENAVKFEHFIFDYFHFCEVAKFGVFECSRDEFQPLKEVGDIEGILERLME